jgi:hypothetical protein
VLCEFSLAYFAIKAFDRKGRKEEAAKIAKKKSQKALRKAIVLLFS